MRPIEVGAARMMVTESICGLLSRVRVRRLAKMVLAMLIPRNGPRLLQKLTTVLPKTNLCCANLCWTALNGIWLQRPRPRPVMNW